MKSLFNAKVTSLLVLMSSMLVNPAIGQETGDGKSPHDWVGPGPAIAGGHVFPHLTVSAPGVGSRSETGIGALIPWADRLWAIGYVAHISGSGIGLYEIRPDLSWRLHPESVTGTFANRLVHWASNQVFIGPHAIDAEGSVRTIPALTGHRLAATANHLTDADKVYFLTMEGLLFETDVHSLESELLFDLVQELDWDDGAYLHFKSAHSAQGRLVVANNTYEEPEYLGTRSGGRLAEWDGTGEWQILERNPFIEVSGKQNLGAGAYYGNPLYAIGWDRASVILRVLHNGEWSRYRLPRGSHSWDHTWNTEWMRLREVQTERYLLDAFGLFYDFPSMVYGGKVWGIRPVSSHLRIIPDFVYWRGMLVLAGDQTDNAVGQPQSGFWFGSIDDLASFGKPAGWGGVWRHEPLESGAVSDPFLMTGFDKKSVHIIRHDGQSGSASFTIEVDPLGDGTWVQYKDLEVPSGNGYVHHEFPDGFSAHWVRVVVNGSVTASVEFFYN